MNQYNRLNELAYLCCTLDVPIDIRNCMAGAFDCIESLQLRHDDAMPLSVIGGGLVDSYLDGDQPGVDACIHAWRALAHLRSALLAPALLQCLAELYDEGAEDQLAEAPELLGISGLPSIGELVLCVITDVYPVPVRNVAVRGLLEIARRHPRERDSVVFSLGHILEEGEIIPPEVNAHIVDALVKLEARDHAETIERAFAAGYVDYGLLGGWDEVRELLGVPGLGLVAEGVRVPLQTEAARQRAIEKLSAARALPEEPIRRKRGVKRKKKKGVRAKNRKK